MFTQEHRENEIDIGLLEPDRYVLKIFQNNRVLSKGFIKN
ncbi:hypothetical protein JYT72_02225 [Crocinitomix catalasitica]|nr:hypothetical protein [Crocinitomix catalasitica]